MKKIFCIIFLILLLTPLAYGADDIRIPVRGAEHTLSHVWEREAEARIWSEHILSSFKNNSSKNFPLNALCDESALNEIKKIKRLSLEIITNDIYSGAGTREGALALKIYKRAEEYFLASDCMYRRILKRFESLPQRERPHVPAGFSRNTHPEAPPLLCSSCTGAAVDTGKPELKKFPLSSGRVKAGSLIYKSVLKPGVLWDREKTDYYRIFLYIRDDDWIGKLPSAIFFPPSVSLIFNSYLPILPVKKEIHHRTNLNTLESLKFFKTFLCRSVLRHFRPSIPSFVRRFENSSPCNCRIRRGPCVRGLPANNKPESIISQGVLL